MLKIATTLLLVACAFGNTVAFVPNSGSSSKTNPSTSIAKDPLVLGTTNFEKEGIPYGEESRKYRRTVYSHDDWIKHRSPDRFLKNLLSTPKSGIYKVSG
jgi:putative membrane protein